MKFYTQSAYRFLLLMILLSFAAGSLLLYTNQALANTGPSVRSQEPGSCQMFPADNIWNYNISNLPVYANSANYIASMDASGQLRGYFGATVPGYAPQGIGYAVVSGSQPTVPVQFYYVSDSDPGPYPIPSNAPVEYGPDKHVLVVNSGTCKLYELWDAVQQTDGSWQAGSGAVWNLNSDALRPQYWTSADAAGLPVLPGLVRYDEVASGAINHALRVVVNMTQAAFLWPARHYASTNTNPNVPPMGLRLRLKSNFDISTFSPQNQVILTALKRYGMFVADNSGGASWVISGAPDPRWNNADLLNLSKVPGSAFEAVDESSLQASPDSGRVKVRAMPHVTSLGKTVKIDSTTHNLRTGTFDASIDRRKAASS